MENKYTLEEIVKVLSEFKDVMNYIRQNQSVWDSTVQECDKAFGDIRHYCELQYPTERKDKTKVVKLIHDTSVLRRQCKDYLEVLNPLFESDLLDMKQINNIAHVINQIKKNQDKQRVYKPRVLEDLFVGK